MEDQGLKNRGRIWKKDRDMSMRDKDKDMGNGN
jgi:hypothetical protein